MGTGAGVGGGYDLQARVTARHLPKHIPGNPAIVVQNMPARIAAANHMFTTAPKDGSHIALIQRGMLLAKLIYPSGTRFEIEKFNWLGSLNSEVAVTLAWNTAPHKTAKDLFDKELIVGGIVGVDPETTPRLYNSLIGTRFKVVTGYNSTSQIALAIERGEVQGIADWSWSSVKAVRPHWLRDKSVTLLMQGALKSDPELGDLPNAVRSPNTAVKNYYGVIAREIGGNVQHAPFRGGHSEVGKPVTRIELPGHVPFCLSEILMRNA